MSDIIVENVSKSFDGREVLHNVNLCVKQGEFVSIMGESGSGKSTLLNIIAGNLPADSGKVELGGKELLKLNDKEMSKIRRSSLGYVYQFFNLIPTMSVRDNILLPIRLANKKVEEVEEKFNELCSFLHIENIVNRYPDKLSGGEQQRVAIARTLIHNPEVILLDEPTGNLDSENATAIMQLLAELNKKYDVTIIQVTHSKQSIEFGGRIITIKDGKIEG